MAWEWAGPASGVLVGLGGLIAGWRFNVDGRKQDARLARERHEHEARMAHDQWHRDRRADAYVQLLDLAEETGQWVQMVYPLIEHGAPSQPELPSLDRQVKAWARVAAYASPAVCDEVRRWRGIGLRAIRAVEDVAGGHKEARLRLHDLRTEEQEAREALSAAISADLLRAYPLQGEAGALDPTRRRLLPRRRRRELG